jgi:hypothetical protein
MAATAAPYGLIPVGLIGGRPFNQAFKQFKVANNYGTSIFKGDVVKVVNDGTVAKDTGTATATPIGIFMGCEFTEPTLGYKVQRNYWTASTVASDIMAYVCDDPQVIMQVQAAATVAQADLFLNAALVQGSGNTANGMSGVGIGSQNTTNTLPVKIIDFVRSGTSTIGDAYTDVLVIWNLAASSTHFYHTALGT